MRLDVNRGAWKKEKRRKRENLKRDEEVRVAENGDASSTAPSDRVRQPASRCIERRGVARTGGRRARREKILQRRIAYTQLGGATRPLPPLLCSRLALTSYNLLM